MNNEQRNRTDEVDKYIHKWFKWIMTQILPITVKSSPSAIALVGLQLPTIISPSHHVTESRGHRRLPQALE